MKENKYSRRRFLSGAAMSLGAAELSVLSLMNTSFIDNKNKEIMYDNHKENPLDNIKQINAGLLNIGYAEAGSLNGTSVTWGRPTWAKKYFPIFPNLENLSLAQKNTRMPKFFRL